MEVIIMRGIPGSGKTTWCRRYIEGRKSAYCSADDYHIKEGHYHFDPKNIGPAHDYCLRQFVRAIITEPHPEGPPDVVVVDNTSLSAWEIAPYYRLAEALGIPVRIVRLHCAFEAACARNVHQVPAARVWAMYQTLSSERLPPHWHEELVVA